MTAFDRLIGEELDRWQETGKTARFWLRDDDAVEPTAALDDFLEIAGAFSVPATLAVIPVHTGDPLVQRLDRERLVSVAVHGWSHRNYAGSDEKKQELGRHRPLADVLAELGAGFEKLAGLHQGRFIPMLVPPWNRIDRTLLPDLPGLGFKALSVYGPEKPAALGMINSHVDVMDWHGTRGGRDPLELASEIVARLQHTFDRGGVTGVLTHHLVHDQAVRDFLTALFKATASHPAARWISGADAIQTSIT
ncbi:MULTISPECIES: polysaccharide deacetylase family protein [unclassified Rhizobium]|uniref:polysaccharide deacetylase family protein n=1 Tax=unclassified Rhizobium TaxID=2613769 RepID=UPI000712F4A2|nr:MULTISPECIES: polysaccharide deacetylase family protein [unclassified Rhizobium]KQS88685.1 polysaccharide deacetylase [Rhizobium sp. Leaf391]KQT05628.1 polysaccharide deacetylase [Rhizobium sp. Leaf386]KQT91352.1 polysaccharide deacetylase [Rhizobium sp. Leaf453]